jgi:virginiamycin B lyase
LIKSAIACIAAAGAAAMMVESTWLAASARACETASPMPTVETWKPHAFTKKGFDLEIFTGPVDRGGDLQLASGPDGALWFAAPAASAIGRFGLAGKVTLWPTPTANAKPEAITAAANDETVWFTEFNTNCVGRITTTGLITEFSTSINPLQSVLAVTGTPAIWFGTDANGIGRITHDGKVSFFDVADNSAQPTALTLDQRGNIWYIEWAGSSVGYIRPTGGGTAYDVGEGGNTFGIALGPDGRIWFADPMNTRIGRINTDGGGLKYFSKGLTGQPDSITVGIDGNLYFGEYSPAVGRITTTGAITELPLPAALGSFPVLSLTSGPDGNIWFTNNEHSQIGRLVP